MFVKGTILKTGILIILTIIATYFRFYILTILLILAVILLLQFFRDPERNIPSDKGLIVAAADGRRLNGKIDIIRKVNYDDPLMKHILDPDEVGILISTFMSGLDVHVNRSPVSGKVIKSKHYPGKFKIASGDVILENEKNLMVIDSPYGKIGVIQIAGFVARRIEQYINVGDWVEVGQRLGMIKLGSRVDVIIPLKNSHILVEEGEKPIAGETILARMVENPHINPIEAN